MESSFGIRDDERDASGGGDVSAVIHEAATRLMGKMDWTMSSNELTLNEVRAQNMELRKSNQDLLAIVEEDSKSKQRLLAMVEEQAKSKQQLLAIVEEQANSQKQWLETVERLKTDKDAETTKYGEHLKHFTAISRRSEEAMDWLRDVNQKLMDIVPLSQNHIQRLETVNQESEARVRSLESTVGSQSAQFRANESNHKLTLASMELREANRKQVHFEHMERIRSHHEERMMCEKSRAESEAKKADDRNTTKDRDFAMLIERIVEDHKTEGTGMKTSLTRLETNLHNMCSYMHTLGSKYNELVIVAFQSSFEAWWSYIKGTRNVESLMMPEIQFDVGSAPLVNLSRGFVAV